MQIFYQPLIPEGQLVLDADESKHCVKVLRKKEGDMIDVVDGKGNFYRAVIREADSRACTFAVEQVVAEEKKAFSIHIGIAPTKNADRLEWFVEKAVEIGIDEISLVICENSERRKLNTERLQRKAVSAMKQSIKATLPLIHEPLPFVKFLEKNQAATEKFLAYVSDTPVPHLLHAADKGSHTVVLIGPEGDFSPAEIQQAYRQGYSMVSLGSARLRTETAGLVACHTLHLLNELRIEADRKT